MRLILASASPRRAELLTAAGFAFESLPVDVDERVLPGEAPEACVRRLASEKSVAALSRVSDPDAVILAADTVVTLDGAILGKPRQDGEAAEMLGRLAGRSHQVWTGLSVRARGVHAAHAEVTAVSFVAMSTAEIATYVQTGEGRDKAGAYGIQGIASRYVDRIEGSYSNVVGLPVAAVYRLLCVVASGGESELS